MASLIDFFSKQETRVSTGSYRKEEISERIIHILFIMKLLQGNPTITAQKRNQTLNKYFPDVAKRKWSAMHWRNRANEAKSLTEKLSTHGLEVVIKPV